MATENHMPLSPPTPTPTSLPASETPRSQPVGIWLPLPPWNRRTLPILREALDHAADSLSAFALILFCDLLILPFVAIPLLLAAWPFIRAASEPQPFDEFERAVLIAYDWMTPGFAPAVAAMFVAGTLMTLLATWAVRGVAFAIVALRARHRDASLEAALRASAPRTLSWILAMGALTIFTFLLVMGSVALPMLAASRLFEADETSLEGLVLVGVSSLGVGFSAFVTTTMWMLIRAGYMTALALDISLSAGCIRFVALIRRYEREFVRLATGWSALLLVWLFLFGMLGGFAARIDPDNVRLADIASLAEGFSVVATAIAAALMQVWVAASFALFVRRASEA